MIRKLIVVLLAVVLTLGMLTSVAVAQQEEVKLRVMFRGDAGSMNRDKIRLDYFESKYPWIKISFEAFPPARFHEFDALLKMWYASGTAPDVICIDFEPLEHVLNGELLPLDELMKADEEFQKWDYWHPRQMEEFTFGGKIYAVPRGLYLYGLWINCDLFDKAGISYPEMGWTIGAFVEIGQKLTKDLDGDGITDEYGYDHPGWSHHDFVSWYAKSLDADFWTYDERTGWVNGSNLKDPRIIESLQWFADLVNKYKISPSPELGELATLGLTFPLGKFGMDEGATWSIGGYRAEIGKTFQWKFVPHPTVKPGLQARGLLLQRPTGAIMSTCEHPEEAWIFLREYSGYEQEKIIFDKAEYQEFGGPYFKDSLILEDWIAQDPPGADSAQVLLDLINTDYPYWSPENVYPRGYEEWLMIWQQEMEPVLRGDKTAEEAINEFFDRANATVVWDKETQEKVERFLK